MGRAPCCDKTKVKRGPWSPEEDNILKNYVQKHGTGGNWIALPHKAGLKRCGKSCRLRWLNYLRPDIKHGGFTDEENNIILSLYNTIGSRWSVIASHLPGRTDNDVKNYWNTKFKKKLLAAGTTTSSTTTTTTTIAALSGAATVSNNLMDSTLNYSLSPSSSAFLDTFHCENPNFPVINVSPEDLLPYDATVVNGQTETLPAEVHETGEISYDCGLTPPTPLSQETFAGLSPSFSVENTAASLSWCSNNGSYEYDAFFGRSWDVDHQWPLI